MGWSQAKIFLLDEGVCSQTSSLPVCCQIPPSRGLAGLTRLIPLISEVLQAEQAIHLGLIDVVKWDGINRFAASSENSLLIWRLWLRPHSKASVSNS